MEGGGTDHIKSAGSACGINKVVFVISYALGGWYDASRKAEGTLHPVR